MGLFLGSPPVAAIFFAAKVVSVLTYQSELFLRCWPDHMVPHFQPFFYVFPDSCTNMYLRKNVLPKVTQITTGQITLSKTMMTTYSNNHNPVPKFRESLIPKQLTTNYENLRPILETIT